MTVLILVRGQPGSGKSTLAKQTVEAWKNLLGKHLEHIETDMFHTLPNGVYEWKAENETAAHEWCQKTTDDSLKDGVDTIVSNTSLALSDIETYKAIAEKNYAEFHVILATGKFQNVHNVPEETLLRMIERFEPYPGEEISTPLQVTT